MKKSLRATQLLQTAQATNEYQYVVMRGKEEFSLQLANKKFKFKRETVMKDGQQEYRDQYQERLWFNERGDKILLIYRNEDAYVVCRLSLDVKAKAFRQDTNFEFKNVKEFIA